ncbi:MAG: GGDEF domain-containing protein [Phycisphaerae bacterium]|mgnify:CR=1 FL=1|jgi:diguanylate cyclase (GGDEF)-like protein|nr:GGDEF domain-containing protein [Phycisphaerae bacterium]
MSARKTRSSIVFAGSVNDELVSTIDQPARHVHSIFDAIGELATSNATDLVEAVVIDDTLLQNGSVEYIDALRRIDPTPTIVVIGSTSGYAEADAHVPTDTTANKLASAIANAQSQPTEQIHDTEVDLDEVLGISDASDYVRETTNLGDIDLVRALMHSPSSFKEVLIDLLKQQTSWSFCAIIDDIPSAPEGSDTAPLRYGHEEHGFLAATGSTSSDLTRWSRWASCWLNLARKQRQLKLLAYKDELSGAWNRRFLRTCLTKELQLARSNRRPLTVMIFDIDNFKHYNDRWGHDAGDEIIRELVRLLRTIIRKGDHVCRIGGDEFAVLFCDPAPPREPGSNHPTTIEILAKRFREQVANARFPKLGDEATGCLSISGGLATYPWDSSEIDGILEKADQRLLKSKRLGKNSITIGKDE